MGIIKSKFQWSSNLISNVDLADSIPYETQALYPIVLKILSIYNESSSRAQFQRIQFYLLWNSSRILYLVFIKNQIPEWLISQTPMKIEIPAALNGTWAGVISREIYAVSTDVSQLIYFH